MNELDKKIREMAANDKMTVPDSLHNRLVTITNESAPKRKGISVQRLVIIAAVLVALGTVTAGAVRIVWNDEMGGHISPRILEKRVINSASTDDTNQPVQDVSAEQYVIEEDDTPASALEDMPVEEQLKALDIPSIKEDEAELMYEMWSTWDAIYQDASKQKEVEQAAIDAYYEYKLWDADVEGARFEHVQECVELRDQHTYEALVVLYLSDGCGYRMHMNCETLELLNTTVSVK